jgi:hypothetical protein|tara:strand:+ start:4984 stop:6129 length:1146 start_codon:yes stop_codon:yes gene_type:complete
MEDQTNTIEQEVVEQPQTVEQAPEQPTEQAPQEQPFQIYDSFEDLQAAQQPAEPQTQPEPQPEQPEQPQYSEPQHSMETQEAPTQPEPRGNYSQQDVDKAVSEYLSERLGMEIADLESLSAQKPTEMDERVAAIAQFVQETGRNPQDWFTYQSLNTSEMDDMTAVRVQLATDNPSLTANELGMLISNKYKMNPDVHTEEEIAYSKLQLKMDANKAKESIEQMRETYKAPEQQEATEQGFDSIIDQDWVNNMVRDVNGISGLEFDLGNDRAFTFNITPDYKRELIEKNTRLDEFFDPYVNEKGDWNYDLLSSHRAVIDNIDSIVKTAYQQGMSDGQRNVVSRASNVQAAAPMEQNTQQGNDIGTQLKNIYAKISPKTTFFNA